MQRIPRRLANVGWTVVVVLALLGMVGCGSVATEPNTTESSTPESSTAEPTATDRIVAQHPPVEQKGGEEAAPLPPFLSWASVEQDASLGQHAGFEIELALPEHHPGPRRVRHVVTGRRLSVRPVTGPLPEAWAGLQRVALVQRDPLDGAALEVRPLTVERRADGLRFTLPTDLASGHFSLDLPVAAGLQSVLLEVRGGLAAKTKTKPLVGEVLAAEASLPPQVRSIRRLGCGSGCVWESVLAMHPERPGVGYFLGGINTLVTTRDGWRTSRRLRVDAVTGQRTGTYFGDPEMDFLPDGRLLLSGLTILPNGQISGGLYADRSDPGARPRFEQTILRPSHNQVPTGDDLIYDFPKIAVDRGAASPWRGSIYVIANAVRFEDGDVGTGFYVVRDGAVEERKAQAVGFRQPAKAMLVGPGGEIYFSRTDIDTVGGSSEYVIDFWASRDGGNSFQRRRIFEPRQPVGTCSARLSSSSERNWLLDFGPDLARDARTGRLYAVWSLAQRCQRDPAVEFGSYAVDMDVWVASSDDGGRNWSAPVRVNDGPRGVDQGAASIEVDSDGAVWVAFFDRRRTRDVEAFDVYVSRSKDGGRSFEPSLRVNDRPIPNTLGGRQPGDYFRMLGLGDDEVYVSHPCVGAGGVGQPLPSDSCIATVAKEAGAPGPGGCDLPVGHGRYCRECGPCAAGEGDCDSDAECVSGSTCRDNIGAQFGFAPGIDVCVAASGPGPGSCNLPVGHGRFCSECGPCAVGEGDCDSDAECAPGSECRDNVGADFGFAPGVDVCVAGGDPLPGDCQLPAGHPRFCVECGPCGVGQGDCDGDSQCRAGLRCANDVGADFGFAANIDVCVAR